MTVKKLFAVFFSATGFVAIPSGIHAATITWNSQVGTFNPGGGMYSYSTSSGFDANAGGSAAYHDENVSGGGTGIYYSVTNGASGTVTYTFDAAPGQTFNSSAEVSQEIDVYAKGSIDGTYTTSGGTLGTTSGTFAGPYTNSDGSFPGSNHGEYPNSVPVAGATSFTLTYTISEASGYSNYYNQLFRSADAASTSTPFTVTVTSSVPEPASLCLLGLSGIGLLTRRRRHSV